jgi:acyl-CoA synthetase (AMP-forming)/AMP-acid ligase II
LVRTGDLGLIDKDGYVSIAGRLKDVIIRNGENLLPAEIEEVLLRHPAVVDAAVMGVPDTQTGERVAAVVVLEPGASLTRDDLSAHFRRQGMARQKTPEQLEVVNEIPRNPMGKPRKDEMRTALVRVQS